MYELNVGDIVRCSDESGVWLILRISRGRNFKNLKYVSIEKILNDDLSIPEKLTTKYCNISLCKREFDLKLFHNIYYLRIKLKNIIKDNSH